MAKVPIQWVNLFPEIKDHLLNIFERYRHVLDAELQQRACEYLALAQMQDGDELLQTVCEEMPVFPERESALLNRLHSKGDKAQDKRTWVIGGKDENKERETERFKSFRKGTGDSGSPMAEEVIPVRDAPQPPIPTQTAPTAQRTMSSNVDTMMGASSSGATDDIMSSLAGLDMRGADGIQDEPLLPNGSEATTQPTRSLSNGEAITNGVLAPTTATLGGFSTTLLAPLTVGPNVDKVGHPLILLNK